MMLNWKMRLAVAGRAVKTTVSRGLTKLQDKRVFFPVAAVLLVMITLVGALLIHSSKPSVAPGGHRAAAVAPTKHPRTAPAAPKTSKLPPQRKTKVKTAKTYVVKAGDCLWAIAKRHLGSGLKWSVIWQLNRAQISNPNVIRTGMVLRI